MKDGQVRYGLVCNEIGGIRDDPDLAGTRVMFLTARADIGDNERARGTGVVGHITKPFNPSSLSDEVRTALAR